MPEGSLSRRQALAAGSTGALGLALAAAPAAAASARRTHPARTIAASSSSAAVQEVVDVAATIEVLTTVVTTTALQKLSLPAAGVQTVGAASREELIHYEVLTKTYGGVPKTHTVWIPDGLFASPTSLFTGLVAGEQFCINLYLIATTVWAAAGRPDLARAGAELVGNEGVHRALARQALGLEPNDRAFMKYAGVEEASGPGHGTTGFTEARGAIEAFEGAGFGFAAEGAKPGAFYEFAKVREHTPDPAFVNTRTPS